MPSNLYPSAEPQKTVLLREAVRLLRWELSAVSNRSWEGVPDLKKKKVVLSSRLRALGRARGATDEEPADLSLIRAQITDLESQSRAKIEGHLDLMTNQIVALQELHQYWRECLSISFRNLYEPTPPV